MTDFNNIFDAAISLADEIILEKMAVVARVTSGFYKGSDISGVFDDPENIGYAGNGVRIEGTSPSLFVKSVAVSELKRFDLLIVNNATHWVDRLSPDDCGSRYIWLGTGTPPASNRRG
ncbi:TPA: phage tail protein [Klebsiella pneumoniae]|nr:phage tail protein [Klebsiella pneumoniae]